MERGRAAHIEDHAPFPALKQKKGYAMNSLPYQKNSTTSKEAAKRNQTAFTTEYKILHYLRTHKTGITGDEAALMFNLQTGVAAARLRGLELKKLIFKTVHIRLTRNNRKACVYMAMD